MEYTEVLQTVVETPAFLSDARALGLPNAERLTIVTRIAANPAAGEVIEVGKEWRISRHHIFLRDRYSGFSAERLR